MILCTSTSVHPEAEFLFRYLKTNYLNSVVLCLNFCDALNNYLFCCLNLFKMLSNTSKHWSLRISVSLCVMRLWLRPVSPAARGSAQRPGETSEQEVFCAGQETEPPADCEATVPVVLLQYSTECRLYCSLTCVCVCVCVSVWSRGVVLGEEGPTLRAALWLSEWLQVQLVLPQMSVIFIVWALSCRWGRSCLPMGPGTKPTRCPIPYYYRRTEGKELYSSTKFKCILDLLFKLWLKHDLNSF